MNNTVIKTIKVLSSVTKLLSNLTLKKNVVVPSNFHLQKLPIFHQISSLHTTSRKFDLMEFFDIKKNWSKDKIQTGREWRVDELRIKSNEDLHRLWFVLLKEKNMLLTMEHACNDAYELFPNPERIDKVEMSMKNLETVVRERNEAYYTLETGETGEQISRYVYNILGMKQYYRLRQHLIPLKYNAKWKSKHLFGYNGYAVRKFLRLYQEKEALKKEASLYRDANAIVTIIRKFPNVDIEALKEKYPEVDMDRVLRSKKLRYLRMRSRFR